MLDSERRTVWGVSEWSVPAASRLVLRRSPGDDGGAASSSPSCGTNKLDTPRLTGVGASERTNHLVMWIYADGVRDVARLGRGHLAGDGV